MSIYSIDQGNSGASGIKQDEVIQTVKDLAPGEKVTVENITAEHEYDVFYGSNVLDQGWSQHRTAKGEDHLTAVINSLRCNYSEGTRFLVVGPDYRNRWHGRQDKVGRVFEVRTCEENDPRLVYSYTMYDDPSHDFWWDTYSYYSGYRRRRTLREPWITHYRVEEVPVVSQ